MGRIQNYKFLEFIRVLIDYQAFITIEQRPTSLLTDLFREMFNTLMKIKKTTKTNSTYHEDGYE